MLLVDKHFFISFLEETIQKSTVDLKFTSSTFLDPLEDVFETMKLICTKICCILFNDTTPQLKKKDDKNFMIVTRNLDFYSVYLSDQVIYKQKNQKVSTISNSVI